MPDREAGTDENEENGKRSSGGQVRLKPAGEGRVRPLKVPIEPRADKQIHPRRPLPLVREGPDNTDGNQ